MKRSESRWLVWQAMALLIIVAALLGEFLFISGAKFLSDEGFNFRQITRFVKGDLSMEPGINMIPGYHAVVALALMLVLLAFYLLLWKRYTLAGFVGILSVLARTNNITWLAFLYIFAYYDNYHLDWRSFLKSLRQTWIYWVGFALFLVFLIANKGIAITDPSVQPTFKFGPGNVIFLLFLFFLLFLPLNLANFPLILSFIRRHIWPVLGITAVVFIFYTITFVNTHPYNLAYPDYYLRNKLLMQVTSGLGLKSLFFLPVAYALFSLCVTPLAEKRFYWLYPFTLLSLAPFWLIEPRYYFVPMSLYILFKTERSPWVEWITIGMYVILSAAILYFTRNQTFFI